jgi:hypothetical protein
MNTISEVTRRDIIDYIIAKQIAWWGRMEEIPFLSRLYDLEKLPSLDSRFQTASRDIWQHRINNYDWGNEWIFYDDRFNILRGNDLEFVRFICEMLHPVVRSDESEVLKIATEFNRLLNRDGWELFQQGDISSRPIYGAKKKSQRSVIFEEPTGWPLVDRQMTEIRARLREAQTEEQFQAIGLLCREAIISVAQAVYNKLQHPSLDGIEPSPTDGIRMLEAFFAVELSGQTNEEIRIHTKASLKMALALQHNRTANFRKAALCAEATASVINIVGIVSGARVPNN